MNNMIGLILALRGLVSESVRAAVAIRLADCVEGQLEDTEWWLEGGRNKFLLDCHLQDNPATVPENIEIVEPGPLAEYINKWRNVVAYRDGDEWVDLPQEMFAMKNTMLEELEAICVSN